LCKSDVNGSKVVLGLENVDPKVRTIAVTMLKTARAVGPAKVKPNGATRTTRSAGATAAPTRRLWP
jgi:hypothetical protein